MGRLDGKVAFITGAARGVGRSIALTFAEEGADLLLSDICTDLEYCPYPMGTEEQLAETAQRCQTLGRKVLTFKVDIRHQEQINLAVRQGLEKFGAIDILVNNAGIVGPGGKPAHLLLEEEWQLLIDVDLNGAWRCAKAVLPSMIKQRAGSIVNISSTAGLVGFKAYAGYVAAKHGLIGLNRALALDYAAYAIRVNAVCPSSIYDDPALDGRMLKGVADMFGVPLQTYEDMSKQYHAFHSLIEAKDVALACLWLASDESKRVTGTIITVDAGFTIK